MANMQKTKIPMAEQDPKIRAKNWSEVALGYTPEQAIEEANRCLECKHAPCVAGCPVGIPIPQFIAKIKAGDFDGANDIVKSASSLGAICGRVCPQENQCEGRCVRGIKGEPVAIGRLERFVSDFEKSDSGVKTCSNADKKVAIIGSGPAGLACAGELAAHGVPSTVFESLHTAGGVLVYGIPEFRLPKVIVAEEVKKLEDMGVEFKCNVVIGRTLTIPQLFEMGYTHVFIGSGAGLPSFLRIPGEDLMGVYSANEYLTRINLMKAYEDDSDTPIIKAKNVAVVGGGNVAMDAARCALRAGADNVYIVYRRGEEELPARAEEVHHAKEEGIIFKLLQNPTAINGDENGFVKSLTLVDMELGEPDASGRRSPVTVAGSEHDIEVDCVIAAVGTSPNPLLASGTMGLETNKRGCIKVDENGRTSMPNVYAGGDAATGAATVILAMGAGKKCAQDIIKE